jgi:DNA polymerase-3 subunit beta
MKISVNQSLLSKVLNVVSKAVSSRTTIPILKGILLKTVPEGLKLSASDLDISIEKTVPVTVLEEGSVVVPASLFTDIVKMLPNGEIEISCDPSMNVTIKCLTSEYSIVGQSPEEFPSIGEISAKETYEFDKNAFKEMISRTSFAASIDESKGIIVGILMELDEGAMNMVALDGFRMAVARSSVASLDRKRIIINARILSEINKILMDIPDADTVKLTLDEKRGVVDISDTKIIIRLLEGEFIRYRDILPKEHKVRVTANRKELVDAIERASVMARKGKNNLIVLSVADDRLTITSRSEEGTVREELFIQLEGDEIRIGFNAKFILDALKAVDDEEILLDMNTSVSPCLIRPVEGDAYEYLILPVRISAN